MARGFPDKLCPSYFLCVGFFYLPHPRPSLCLFSLSGRDRDPMVTDILFRILHNLKCLAAGLEVMIISVPCFYAFWLCLLPSPSVCVCVCVCVCGTCSHSHIRCVTRHWQIRLTFWPQITPSDSSSVTAVTSMPAPEFATPLTATLSHSSCFTELPFL